MVGLLSRVVDLPGITGFDYRDERGVRSPTGEVRDERYHLPISCEWAGGLWRIDLTLWLHDPHLNVTAWHEHLRDTVSIEQRLAILGVKDVWHRLPLSGPGQRLGDLQCGAPGRRAGPAEFSVWLTDHGLIST